MASWSDKELKASVSAYRAMQQAHASGTAVNKKEIYRQLVAAHGRTTGAFEYRMQNISAVLHGLEQDWLPGLKPAGNVGRAVRAKLIAFLSESKTKASDYVEKLPAIRARLIGIARAGAQVTYGQLMKESDLNRFVLRHAMSKLGWQAHERGEPILTP